MNLKLLMAASAAAGVMCLAGVAQAESDSAPTLTDKDLAPAVEAFLEQHGDLCFAWYTWPRDLTAEEQQSGMGPAVQFPVLERLGILRSVALRAPKPKHTAAAAVGAQSSEPESEQLAPPVPTRRYSLTAKGQQYYLRKQHKTLDVHGMPEVHDADFCVAHLTLDKVVKWTPPETADGTLETAIRYTYRVKAAPFMSDPEVQQVFPMADNIIRGEGKLLMNASAQLQDGTWVPVLPQP